MPPARRRLWGPGGSPGSRAARQLMTATGRGIKSGTAMDNGASPSVRHAKTRGRVTLDTQDRGVISRSNAPKLLDAPLPAPYTEMETTNLQRPGKSVAASVQQKLVDSGGGM
jgi:hypothetical protein